jgi:signal transduction histidine kinase
MSLCQGSGLKNIENRVQLLNGKLEYSYSVGSIFNLEFPI